MASLLGTSILGFRGLCSTRGAIPAITVLKLDFKVAPRAPPSILRSIRFRVRQSLPIVFASNNNPSAGDSLEEKSGGIKTDDSAQGPPLLTILAGILVFFLICWIIGSIVMWLVGLILNPPPLK